MKPQSNSFLSNSIITLTRQIASIIIGFLLLVLMANALGTNGQGKYTLITYLPLMLMTFLNFGLNSSTVYFVSRKNVSLTTALNTNIITGLLLSFTSILFGVAAVYIFGETYFKSVNSQLLFVSLTAMPGMFLMIFLQTILQGIQNFKAFNTALVIQQFSTVFFVVLFLYILDLDLLGAILSFVLGYTVAVIYMLIYLITRYKVTFSIKEFSFAHLKSMIGYGLKAHVSNMMTFLNYRLDIIILGLFLSPVLIGLYSVAVSLGERLSIFSQSFSQVLLPRIASSDIAEDRNRITSMVSRFILAFVLILSCFIFIFSDLFFEIFMKEFVDSSLLLKLLLPGLTLLAVEKILSNDLAGRGKPELNMYVSFFNVALNLVLNLILIPQIGVKGAAISSSITYIASFLIKAWIYKRETKLNYREFLLMKKSDFMMMKNIYLNLRKKTAVSK